MNTPPKQSVICFYAQSRKGEVHTFVFRLPNMIDPQQFERVTKERQYECDCNIGETELIRIFMIWQTELHKKGLL